MYKHCDFVHVLILFMLICPLSLQMFQIKLANKNSSCPTQIQLTDDHLRKAMHVRN
jgi:hypothetical protein